MLRFLQLVCFFVALLAGLVFPALPGAGLAQEPQVGGVSALPSKSEGLWVTSPYYGFVSEFEDSALLMSGIPKRNLNTGFSRVGPPGKVAFDANHNGWLPLCGTGGGSQFPGGLVIELTPATQSSIASGQLVSTKVKILTDSSFACPQAVAVDPSGNLWIASYSGYQEGAPAVTEYPAAQLSQEKSVPSVVVTSTSFSNPRGITFDSSGNLWVADSDVLKFTVQQLAQGGSLSPNLTLSNPNHPFDVLFDSSGNLWVSYPPNFGMSLYAGALELFAANDLRGSGTIDPAPLVTISPRTPCSPFSICLPSGEALDSAGDLWVSANGNIFEFTPAMLGSSGSPLPHLIWAPDFIFRKRSENFAGPSFLTFGPAVP